MPFQCPHCHRPIYNRRRKDCEFCRAAIPDALRFSPHQLRTIENMKAREAAEHRQAMSAPTYREDGANILGPFL